MSTLVHITDEKHTASILRSGIRLQRGRKAIYFMPVVQSHFVSHQWIRELRRSGARVLVGVYFRLPNTEKVWAGKYNEQHRFIMLGEAIRELLELKDSLGYEIFTDKPIPTSAIQKIRTVPQKVGWRYMPHAHERKWLCGCPQCMPRGMIKGRKLRERLEPPEKRLSFHDVKAKLAQRATADDIETLLWELRYKYRRTDPEFLVPFLTNESNSVREDVALTLPFFRHPRSIQLLEVLAKDRDSNVANSAAEGLGEIKRRRGERSS